MDSTNDQENPVVIVELTSSKSTSSPVVIDLTMANRKRPVLIDLTTVPSTSTPVLIDLTETISPQGVDWEENEIPTATVSSPFVRTNLKSLFDLPVETSPEVVHWGGNQRPTASEGVNLNSSPCFTQTELEEIVGSLESVFEQVEDTSRPSTLEQGTTSTLVTRTVHGSAPATKVLPIAGPSSSKDVVLQMGDEEKKAGGSSGNGNSLRVLGQEIMTLLSLLLSKKIISKKEHKGLEKKLQIKAVKLRKEGPEIHLKLGRLVALTTEKFKKLSDFANVWAMINELVQKFDLHKLQEEEEEAPKNGIEDGTILPQNLTTQYERDKLKSIRVIEEMMNEKLSKEIERLSTEEVDIFDDNPYHSAYFLMGRHEEMYERKRKLVCELSHCSSLTDRPVFHRLNLKNCSQYPAFENVVEVYLNSKLNTVPCYTELCKIISSENDKAHLNFDKKSVEEISEHMLELVIKKQRLRRAKDSQLINPEFYGSGVVLEDPADHDLELARKLEANKVEATKSRNFSPVEVMERFKDSILLEDRQEDNVDDQDSSSSGEKEFSEEDESLEEENNEAIRQVHNTMLEIANTEKNISEDVGVEPLPKKFKADTLANPHI